MQFAQSGREHKWSVQYKQWSKMRQIFLSGKKRQKDSNSERQQSALTFWGAKWYRGRVFALRLVGCDPPWLYERVPSYLALYLGLELWSYITQWHPGMAAHPRYNGSNAENKCCFLRNVTITETLIKKIHKHLSMNIASPFDSSDLSVWLIQLDFEMFCILAQQNKSNNTTPNQVLSLDMCLNTG